MNQPISGLRIAQGIQHVRCRRVTSFAHRHFALQFVAEVQQEELADYWQATRKQTYKQIKAGTLVAIRIGPRLRRIRTSDAIRFEKVAKMSSSSER